MTGAPVFHSILTMEEIEKNFEGIDFFSGVMEGLECALAHEKEHIKKVQDSFAILDFAI